MSLTIIVGAPGTGKSKAIRDRYLKVGSQAIFLDGHHDQEVVRQIRHEMGYFDHHYLACPPENLWPELNKISDFREIFIDMPGLSGDEYAALGRLADERNWHLTLTARSMPSGLEDAEIIKF